MVVSLSPANGALVSVDEKCTLKTTIIIVIHRPPNVKEQGKN